MALYFEDIEVGTVREFGNYTLTEEEIIAFAEQWDPQPFHVDPEAAAETMYGGLIASGIQTFAITMRMVAENFLNHTVTVGARGVDDLRWYRPVRPGDTLSVRHEILEKRVENDERGVIPNRWTTLNQDGEKVFSLVGLNMFLRR